MSSLRTMRSVCSPALRQASGPGLGDAITFMAMMRGGHAMVVRPAAVSFSRARVSDDAGGTVSQPVHLRDGAGRHCRADNLLKRQGAPAGASALAWSWPTAHSPSHEAVSPG